MAESDLSSEVNATTVLPAPSNVDATYSGGDVDVTWTNNDDSSDGGIDVERRGPADWSYRKPITIDSTKVDADLTDYPATIHLDSDSDLAAGAQSSGNDIKFEDANGNQLSHEIESYDASTGTLWAHVKIPSLSSSSDTIIYVYYGNDSASNQESVADVWSNNFEAVYHLDESASGTGNADVYKDSTANDNHGDDYVSSSVKDGQIGDGQTFDGTDDYIEVPHSSSLNVTSGLTLSFWTAVGSLSGYTEMVGKPSYFDWGIYSDSDSYDNTPHYNIHVEGTRYDFRGPSMSGGNLHRVSQTYDGDVFEGYFDGGTVNSDSSMSGNLDTNTDSLMIAHSSTSGRYFETTLDEIRVSSIARSDAWLSTSYTNQNSPRTFYTVGAETSATGSWTDVTTGLSPTTESYTDTTVSRGTTYEYRIERNTDHATATSGTASITTYLTFERSMSSHGGGGTESAHGSVTKSRNAIAAGTGATATQRSLEKSRAIAGHSTTSATSTHRTIELPRQITAHGNGTTAAAREPITKSRSAAQFLALSATSSSRVTDKSRSTHSYGNSATSTSRETTRTRSITGHGSGATQMAAELTEVFPSESSADLDFDMVFDPILGFASEWVSEKSVFDGETAAFTVVLDVNLVSPFTIRVQYDETGDGTPDYTTGPRLVKRDDQVISFDELGQDGQYRIIISGMRPPDHLRAITWGPTRY